MTSINRQITLAARPVGLPRASDFNLIESAIAEPGADEVLVRTLYLSVDPYMRGLMSDAESYARPLQIGQVLVGGAVGQVVQANDPNFAIGDIVQGPLGWQEYAVIRGSELRKIDPSLAPISTALGVLGMPGLTAYFGLLDIGAPRGVACMLARTTPALRLYGIPGVRAPFPLRYSPSGGVGRLTPTPSQNRT